MTSLHSPPASPPRQRQPSPSSTPSTHPDIPYNASFTTALSAAVLRPNTVELAQRSIRIVTSSTPSLPLPTPSASSSKETSKSNSIPLRSIDFPSLPSIPANEIPLPLDDTRRRYESAVPGVLLTHPGGHLEGGMGDGNVQTTRGLRVVLPSGGEGTGVGDDALTLRTLPASTPTADSGTSSINYSTYLSLLLDSTSPDPSTLTLTSPATISPNTTSASASAAAARKSAFHAAVAAEIAVQRAELEKRLKARERVVRRNEELKRKIGDLEVQRSVERRVEEGWRAKRRGVVG